MRRGLFLTLEGVDGSGKSTQAEMVSDWLAFGGHVNHQTCEPSYGPIGELIRAYLAGHHTFSEETMALLFAADRSDHVSREILPSLHQHHHIVCDRYIASSLGYQGQGKLGMEGVWALNRTFPQPDLTIFLVMDVDTSLHRLSTRYEEGRIPDIYEGRQQIGRTIESYSRALSFLSRKGWQIALVDGRGSPYQVHELVKIAVTPLLHSLVNVDDEMALAR